MWGNVLTGMMNVKQQHHQHHASDVQGKIQQLYVSIQIFCNILTGSTYRLLLVASSQFYCGLVLFSITVFVTNSRNSSISLVNCSWQNQYHVFFSSVSTFGISMSSGTNNGPSSVSVVQDNTTKPSVNNTAGSTPLHHNKDRRFEGHEVVASHLPPVLKIHRCDNVRTPRPGSHRCLQASPQLVLRSLTHAS
jgi:hypothetical protein